MTRPIRRPRLFVITRQDGAVADADHLRAGLALDVHVVAVLLVRHDVCGALATPHLVERVAVERTVVRGGAAHREAAVGQAGQRADHRGRHGGDRLRALEHVGDVPVGVVVGEDRAAQIGLCTGRLQVARGGEDRVNRVVRVAVAVAVGVGPVRLPCGRHELHPALRAGGRDVEVAAVVGLDLVDRREDLPAHAVLDAGGLVDRQQEDRDPEPLDHEVRHSRHGRGRRQQIGGGLLHRLLGLLLGAALLPQLGRAAARVGPLAPERSAALGCGSAADLLARGRLRRRLGLRLRTRLGPRFGLGLRLRLGLRCRLGLGSFVDDGLRVRGGGVTGLGCRQ